jgi:hypothetical protein
MELIIVDFPALGRPENATRSIRSLFLGFLVLSAQNDFTERKLLKENEEKEN